MTLFTIFQMIVKKLIHLLLSRIEICQLAKIDKMLNLILFQIHYNTHSNL